MSTGPEKFLVAAMPDAIQQGQQFSELPPHMRYAGWIALDKRFQPEIEYRFDGWFKHQPAIGPLMTDKIIEGMNARVLKGHVDNGPFFGLYHFMKSHGRVSPGDERFTNDRKNPTLPMLVAPESMVLRKDVPIRFDHVALLSLRQANSGDLVSQVEKVVALEDSNDQEAA